MNGPLQTFLICFNNFEEMESFFIEILGTVAPSYIRLFLYFITRFAVHQQRDEFICFNNLVGTLVSVPNKKAIVYCKIVLRALTLWILTAFADGFMVGIS